MPGTQTTGIYWDMTNQGWESLTNEKNSDWGLSNS
jgi:hypothetical protein